MKKINLLALLFVLFFTSCNTEAIEPKFQKVENITVDDLSASNVVISGDVVIYNPNPVAIYLNQVEVDIFANDIKVGHVNQNKQAEIAKKSNFSIPLTAIFNPQKLFKGNLRALLDAALNSYVNKKVMMRYEGFAEFEVKGVKFKVPFNYEDEILLEEE